MHRLLILCLLLPLLSGCSVYLAASGSKEPDFSKLAVGMRRAVVEQEFGPAREEKSNADGTSTAIYRYKLGDQSSAGRAILYLVGDIVTFCLAEYLFWPLEISNSGNAYQATFQYDAQEKVLRFSEKQEIGDEEA